MTTKTISGTYSAGYKVSSGVNDIGVTSTGSIGGAGLVATAYLLLDNYGRLEASKGANGVTLGSGGGDVFNYGSIFGGAAKVSSGAGSAGNSGGVGLYSRAYGVVHNYGQIAGGGGGAGIAGTTPGAGGAGGAGLVLHAGFSVREYGIAAAAQTRGGAGGTGGYGASSGAVGGAGGAGADLTVSQYALVGTGNDHGDLFQGGAGGSGGASGAGGSGGGGGAGGTGMVLANSDSLQNYGSIVGGAGGAGGTFNTSGNGGAGGVGGAGLSLGSLSAVGTVDNRGAIAGGAGGTGNPGGNGGSGVQVLSSITMENLGTIFGGRGGAGSQNGVERDGYSFGGTGGSGGAGVQLQADSSLSNHGDVYGGAGGVGGGAGNSANPYGYGGAGGQGGAGVLLLAPGSATYNYNFIHGGAGGAGGVGFDVGYGGAGGQGGAGVVLNNGGSVSGGIYGGAGGAGGAASALRGRGGYGGAGGAGGAGVLLSNGGDFYNERGYISGGAGGAAGDGLNAYGAAGVGGAGVSGSVFGNIYNIGTIVGGAGGKGAGRIGSNEYGGATGGAGVLLSAGGYLVNNALIGGGAGGVGEAYGGAGVTLGATGTVTNNGSIVGGAGGLGGFQAGEGGAGVALAAGGLLRNRGVISGGVGGAAYGGAAGGGGYGVDLANGGTVFNYGTISGGMAGSGGPSIQTGGLIASGTGAITNGSSTDTSALIGYNSGASGGIGVRLSAGSDVTVTNFGTISGYEAVGFYSSLDTLIVEGGSVFIGQSYGDGGALVLASGTGTVAASSGVGLDVTVSGSSPTATFKNFGSLEIGAGASFTMAAGAVVGTADVLTIAGTLTIASTVSVEGVLDVGGRLAGAKKSALIIDGGMTTFTKGASLTVPTVDVSGTATVAVASNLKFKGQWEQTAGTLAVDKGDTLTLGGSGSTFSGALTGAGSSKRAAQLDFNATSAAVDTLNGVTISALNVSVVDTTLKVGASGATVALSGTVTFNGAGSGITAASASDILTNGGIIYSDSALGEGQLGLMNNGIIQSQNLGATSTALVINTGSGEDINNHEIAAKSAGGVIIQSTLVNNGTLLAGAGALVLDGAVSGTGSGQIAGGTLDAASTFNQAVTFTGAGTLELADSQAYTATVTGFSTGGGTFLDLEDIGFVSASEATFSGTAAGGTLTVSDGTHTAQINLSGDYLSSSFVCASDGHGGVIIHDPSQGASAAPPSPHALIAAMAAMGDGAAAAALHSAEPWRGGGSSLIAPRCAIV